jgi:hypothetical protein
MIVVVDGVDATTATTRHSKFLTHSPGAHIRGGKEQTNRQLTNDIQLSARFLTHPQNKQPTTRTTTTTNTEDSSLRSECGN